MQSYKKRRAAWLLPLTSLLVAQAGYSMDYSANAGLDTLGSYSNNIRLQPDKESAAGINVIPSLSLEGTSETSQLSFDGSASFKRFNVSSLDTNDQTLDLSYTRMFEKSTVGLSASAIRDSTLTSELLDSGRVTNASRRQRYQISPSLMYMLGERDQLSLGGSYSESQYDSGAYNDFTYWQGNLQWTHILNERLKLFLAASHSNYRTQNQQFLIQSYYTTSIDSGFQLGGSYLFSEKLSTSILFGRTRNSTRYNTKLSAGQCASASDAALNQIYGQILLGGDPLQLLSLANAVMAQAPLCSLSDQDSNTPLSTLDASLTWNSERHQLSLDAAQSTQPSSNGYTIKQARLKGTWNYRLWEHGTLNVDLTVGQNRALGGSNDDTVKRLNDRTFAYSSIAYRHFLTEEWSVEGRYLYQFQRYDEQDPDLRATSQAVFLGIRYQPRAWHWSR